MICSWVEKAFTPPHHPRGEISFVEELVCLQDVRVATNPPQTLRLVAVWQADEYRRSHSAAGDGLRGVGMSGRSPMVCLYREGAGTVSFR